MMYHCANGVVFDHRGAVLSAKALEHVDTPRTFEIETAPGTGLFGDGGRVSELSIQDLGDVLVSINRRFEKVLFRRRPPNREIAFRDAAPRLGKSGVEKPFRDSGKGRRFASAMGQRSKGEVGSLHDAQRADFDRDRPSTAKRR